MLGFIRLVKKAVEKYFFNPKWRCNACGKEIFTDEYFCEDCLLKLPHNDLAICNHCGRKLISAQNYCSTCRERLVSLDKCRSAFVYEKPISTLIKKFKYSNGRYLAQLFAKYLSLVYFKNYFNADFLLFVPMTDKAKRKRGFNQSELLAQSLSQIINVPIVDAVKKVKETERQARLNKSERIKNLSSAFRVKDKKLIHIILKNVAVAEL